MFIHTATHGGVALWIEINQQHLPADRGKRGGKVTYVTGSPRDNLAKLITSRGNPPFDVIEMDAASHTGIDDIREIIDAVRYASVSARYKIYIIDEVHMLSKNAFNALLKTLEEPPEHVKFLFATTEVAKVPVTVLSRCQRFDLRRIPADKLAAHFAPLAKSLAENESKIVAELLSGSSLRIAVRNAGSLIQRSISV